METSLRCQKITAAAIACLVAFLISAARADAFVPGDWNGEWVSQSGHSSGQIYSQIDPLDSNYTGQMTLTNSPCTDQAPLAATYYQGALGFSGNCSGCFLAFVADVLQGDTVSGQYDVYCGGKFYDQGTFALNYTGLWTKTVGFGNGWVSLYWFGDFCVNSIPWIYHQTLAWLYPFGTSQNSIWFWDPQWDQGKGGWWWTSSSTFPWIYSDTEKTWFYYDAMASTVAARWFCNSAGCQKR